MTESTSPAGADPATRSVTDRCPDPPDAPRQRMLHRRARTLAWATVAYNTAVGAVAVPLAPRPAR